MIDMRHIANVALSGVALLAVGCNPAECGDPGGMFGPCEVKTCAAGLQCFSAESGDICVPSSSLEGDDLVLACAAAVGREGLSCAYEVDQCRVSCDDADGAEACDSGAVCDPESQTCVYPE